jgi:membrane-bound lytic murein transglycosylase A
LIADGSLKREEVSLQSIRAWLLANPARARAVMETNRSYIFFAETPWAIRRWAVPVLGRQSHAAGQPGGGSTYPRLGRAFLWSPA